MIKDNLMVNSTRLYQMTYIITESLMTNALEANETNEISTLENIWCI